MQVSSSVVEALVCGVCRMDGEAIYSMDARGEEELVAEDDGEQVEQVQASFTPISPPTVTTATIQWRMLAISLGVRIEDSDISDMKQKT